MRQVLLLLPLFGCGLLVNFDEGAIRTAPEICTNGVDDNEDGRTDCADSGCVDDTECLEVTGPACNDQADNDLDGKIDCADPGCTGRLVCLAGASWSRDPQCPGTPRFTVVSDFRGAPAASDTWDQGGDQGAQPESTPNGLDLAPVPERGSFIRTRGRFDLSASSIAFAEFDLGAIGRGERSGAGRLEIRLVAENASIPEVQVDLQWSRLGGLAPPGRDARLTLGCRYRAQLRTETTLDLDSEEPVQLRVEVLQADRVIAVFESSTATELCRTTPLDSSAASVRLEVTGQRSSIHDPPMLLSRLVLRTQNRPADCVAVREPILAPGFCRTDPDLAWDATPTPVAWATAGQVHLLAAAERSEVNGPSRRLTGMSSTPGRHDWRPSGLSTAGLQSPRAVTLAPDGQSTLAWAACSGCGGGLSLYALQRGEWLEAVKPVQLDQRAPPSSFPGAVRWDGDHFRALFGRISQSGVLEVAIAESYDGLSWDSRAEPALAPSGPVQWDSGGVGFGVATLALDDYVWLAYGGRVEGGRTAIGLAYSADGDAFIPLPGNPIFIGVDAGFDDGGVVPILLQGRDRTLELYYQGQSSQRPPDCLTGAATDVGAGLGVAVLQGAPPP